MAKEKKRGFFSWLGFGKEEQTQQSAEQQQSTEATSAPVDEVCSLASAEAQAEETVVVTEQIAEQQRTPSQESCLVEVEEAAQPEEKSHSVAVVEADPQAEEQANEAAVEHVSALEQMPPDALVGYASEPEEQVALSDEALTDSEVRSGEGEEIEENIVSDLPLAAAPVVAQERPGREGFFARLKRSLVKTRENLGSGFISLFRGKEIDDDLFEELEEQLLIADVGVETTRRIIASLTQQASRKQLRDAEALYGLLKAEMAGILEKVDQPLDISNKTPFVILMVGVNGVGKTTTIGKLARQYQAQGKSVMLAAGDTFRAAAVEQLQVWGQRNNIPVVAQHTGADSASVIFDAIQAAKSRHADVLIADTAGRLQNKAHLMEELKKITRVMKKLDEDAPHEVMLTLDASTGQNAISQAKLFHEAVGLSGITLTKLDGTAKGGVIFSVADQFGIPIRYIGVGEGIEDLRPFKAADFIEALFAREE